jgi:predicted metal-dependent HD superfamily phosphohydrolase
VIDARQSWARAWRGIGAVDDGAAVRDSLLAAYAEPQRAYHTLQHLHECLDLLAPVAGAAARPCEVEVALWFHDAIYDVRRSDNEERSADWASAAAAAAGAVPAAVERIRSLVLATKHSVSPGGDDERLLVDIDLAILGAPAERFAEYERQIRAEYACVPQPLFDEKRAAILRSFLARERIFATPLFHSRFEAAARANLTRAVGG